MNRLLNLIAVSGLLLSSVGCCCLGGGYGACYPPANPCPGGNCGIGAAAVPGVATRDFYGSYTTTQAMIPSAVTGPVAIGPIIPGPVSYAVPTTTTTFMVPTTTTAALQPLPTY